MRRTEGLVGSGGWHGKCPWLGWPSWCRDGPGRESVRLPRGHTEGGDDMTGTIARCGPLSGLLAVGLLLGVGGVARAQTDNVRDLKNKELDRAQAELAQTRSDLAEARQALARARTDLEANRKALLDAREAQARAQNELSATQKSLADNQRQLANTQAELAAAQKALQEAVNARSAAA